MTSWTAKGLTTDKLQKKITQTAHGFEVGDLVINDALGGPPVYIFAQADTPGNSKGTMMVSRILDVDNFVLTQTGYVTNITAQVIASAGLQYYLSSSILNTLTLIAPTTPGQVFLPCFVSDSTTSGFFFGGSGTIIASGGGGGGITWSVVGVNTAMAVNTGYFSSSAGTINLTLPAAAALGDVIRISNLAGNFHIVQGAGQSIRFGDATTVVGAGGSITSTGVGDTLELVCYNANVGFQVLSSMGNLTIV